MRMATHDGLANAPAGATMSVSSMKLAEFSAWARIDVDVAMPALSLAAAKKGGAVPDWRFAALGLFSVNDLVDDKITDRKFLDLIQDPNDGHFRVNGLEQVPGTVIDVPASKVGGMSDTVSDTLLAQALDGFGARTGDDTVVSTNGSTGDTAASTGGTVRSITVADGTHSVTAATPVDNGSVAEPVSNFATVVSAPSITAVTPIGTGSAAEPVSNGAMVVPVGGALELTSAFSGTVTFAGATGTLKIDNSSSFSGTIARQLAIGDVIDLTDITAGANATITYSGNNSPGTLTVSDGTHTTNISLQGNYSLANFTASSDGHGGTLVIDPPTSLINGSYLAGVNLAWNAYGADFGTGPWGYLADWNAVTSELSAFQNEGVTTVRWWVFGDGRYSPVFNPDGTTAGLNSGFLSDIDHALQIASADNVKLLLTLVDQTMFNFRGGRGRSPARRTCRYRH